MEMVGLLEEKQLALNLVWLRRDRNEEADALTNEDFSSYDMRNRIEVDASRMNWPIFEKFYSAGLEYENNKVRPNRGEERPGKKARKKKKTSHLTSW